MEQIKFKLNCGDVVLARLVDGEPYPKTFANRTQAQNAADKIEGAEVIVKGRPFYVLLPVIK